MQRATKLKAEFLSTKLSTLPKRELFKVVATSFNKLSDIDCKDFMDNWESYKDDDFDDDDDESVSTLDVASLLENSPDDIEED